MIGRLEKTVIDCPDPRALAEFYCQLLGMRVNEDIGDWVVIGQDQGFVRRINARSTEIETFERATLIVPNLTLVTGAVKRSSGPIAG